MRKTIPLLIVLMIFGTLVCGCISSDTKSADAQIAPATTTVTPPTTIKTTVTTPQPTPQPTPKYAQGDVVAWQSDEDYMGRVILGFNETSHRYLVDHIYRNHDGTWGHTYVEREGNWHDYWWIEDEYPYVIGHVNPDAITVDDPTIPEPEPITIKIEYSGSWSGSYGDLGSTESIDGSGSRTITIDNPDYYVGAVIQKSDESSRKLTVKIMRGKEVLEEGSTSAAYGVVTVSKSF